MSEDHGPFRFRVSSVFTITGRGLVAAGVIEQGVVHTGDRLIVHHEGSAVEATCSGVEMIRAARPIPRETVGLLLPELTTADVADGDLITSANDAAS